MDRPVASPADDGIAPADADVTAEPGRGSNPSMRLLRPHAASAEALVEAARDGSREAFEELVRRTHADAFSLARRMVSDDDDAREVVQEAYLRAFRSIRRFRGDAAFSTWLHRITANCASTHLGRRLRHRHDELDDDAVLIDLQPERDPSLATDATLLRQRVDDAIAELPTRLRAVVVLRDVYDFNHAEIAEELGISESAAKVRLHRARRRLRAQVFPARATEVHPDGEEHARAV